MNNVPCCTWMVMWKFSKIHDSLYYVRIKCKFLYRYLIVTSDNVRVYEGIISWSAWLNLLENYVINWKSVYRMEFYFNDNNFCVMHCKYGKWIDVKWRLVWVPMNKHGNHRDDCNNIYWFQSLLNGRFNFVSVFLGS